MIDNKEYSEHAVFKKLERYSIYYECLGDSSMYFIGQGTQAILGIDSYMFSSMGETLDSIKGVLLKGRLGDAYALLRKYHDASKINVYTTLYLGENFSIENFIVQKIENWRTGKEPIPRMQTIDKYIKSSLKVKELNDLLGVDNRYTKLRDRCNDYTHYNYYKNVFLNNGKIYLEKRINFLERFSLDLEDVFVMHLSYLFFVSDEYLMSSDYRESMEEGITPEPGSENFVAPFAQELFTEVICKRRPDLASAIKSHTSLNLE